VSLEQTLLDGAKRTAMEDKIYDLAVIGGGGGGTMAYLRGVLNANHSVLFTGDADAKRKGRATWVMDVDNIPGMHGLERPITKTASTTLKWIKDQDSLKDFGTVMKAKVTNVRIEDDLFVLEYSTRKESASLRTRHVILATGIMDVQPEIGGSIEPIFPYANKGEAIYCVRCDGHRTLGHTLSVVGRNDTAIHIACMMMDRYGQESVPILTNGPGAEFSDDALAAAKLYGLEIIEQPITSANGDPETGLSGFTLEGGREVHFSRTIIALGIIAYNQLLLEVGGEVDSVGKAKVDEHFESSVPNFFVVGDLASGSKMQIYTAWDEAVDAADTVDRRVRAMKRKVRKAAQA
jgi:thioredoxin reductase (NADPH)